MRIRGGMRERERDRGQGRPRERSGERYGGVPIDRAHVIGGMTVGGMTIGIGIATGQASEIERGGAIETGRGRGRAVEMEVEIESEKEKETGKEAGVGNAMMTAGTGIETATEAGGVVAAETRLQHTPIHIYIHTYTYMRASAQQGFFSFSRHVFVKVRICTCHQF